MTPTARAHQYAADIRSGKIPANKWVKLACARFENDLKRAGTAEFPYIYDQTKADRAVSFMELMPHTKGKWAAQKARLVFQNWQCFIDCNLFGWVHMETGLRRFRKSFELIPRKNGKSAKAAARGIYLFCADGETGAEVYSGATTEKQAFEVYGTAWNMMHRLPQLKARYEIHQSGNAKNPGTSYIETDMSKFEVLVGQPRDGASPHGGIIDEYHEHDSDHMLETLETGMGAREQPLLSVISTAGANLGGPCYAMKQEMEAVLTGTVEDETIFAIMYGIDEGDRWDDEANLIKANPNYGVSVYAEFLLQQLKQARRSARKQNAFRTKHLNEWVGAKMAWMNMIEWKKCEKKHLTIEMFRKDSDFEDYRGLPCRVSSDLASKTDIAATDITFKKGEDYFTFKKFWCPEDAVLDNEKYQEFVNSGHLEETDGAMIDYETIEDFIKDLNRDYNVIDSTFDEWQADYMMQRLQKTKLRVIKYPFNTRTVSEPMKMIEALVLDEHYFHDGNPLMNWMMGNVIAKPDGRDNIFLRKAESANKIDGVAAAIMSMGRWMVDDKPKKEYKVYFVGGGNA